MYTLAGKKVGQQRRQRFDPSFNDLPLELNHTKTSSLRVAAFIMDPAEAVVSDEEHLQ
jgi:hypothetical protein